MTNDDKMHVAIIGSGAAGLSAAWLLSQHHKVTVLENQHRAGGHAHTKTIGIADGPSVPMVAGGEDDRDKISCITSAEAGADSGLKIDTGFIVYNEPSYPNMTRWFEALNVATENSDMSFAVSRDNGEFEYAGGPALGLLAQPSLLLRSRFWRMIRDLLRFYREAADHIPENSSLTLGEFLQQHDYSDEFIHDHLLPFGAAIWSTSKMSMLDYPAAAFIRFCDNHGLLQISNRPQWRTVTGGSERYVSAVCDAIGHDCLITNFDTQRIIRHSRGVEVVDRQGHRIKADHVVVATHADQALALIDDPTTLESAGLSPFKYEKNAAYLHTDTSYLPKRRRAWCSWNYVENQDNRSEQVSVSYWMNRLQNLRTQQDYIVTLNPTRIPQANRIHRHQTYHHPIFTSDTWTAQQSLWQMQGNQRTWFCGSYFGAGFHEDAVQSGLAVAEHLGGRARPWSLSDPSNRIVVPSRDMAAFSLATEVAA